MHPVNELLSLVGLRLARASYVPKEFRTRYKRQWNELQKSQRAFRLFKEFYCDMGNHPRNYMDAECEFTSGHLRAAKPGSVLDIGSYRLYVLGMLANYNVTTLDIRERKGVLENETVLTSDAKKLEMPSDTFDAVVSLCALEHLGLGRYGDEFDADSDKKAFAEMVRVLKPGGVLIFSTAISRATPSIAFNAHRIYSLEMIHEFCSGLDAVEEKFYSQAKDVFCLHEEISDLHAVWDIYCGCWRKR
jgi:SAM-dependent methyltransferase